MSLPPRNRRKTFVLADLTAKALDPVLAKQGFGQTDIVLHWEEIVGERLARVCEPVKLQWPARAPKAAPGHGPEPASLVVRVESGFAIELQHLSALVLERVNMHLGWKAVGRILIRQGPIGLSRPPKRHKPVPDQAAKDEAEKQARGIEDEALREALARLGAQVIAEKRGPARR
jgi:hypothetical protein